MAFLTLSGPLFDKVTVIPPLEGVARCPLQHRHCVTASAGPSPHVAAAVPRGSVAARFAAAAITLETSETHGAKGSTFEPSNNPQQSGRPPPRTSQRQLQTPRAPKASTRRRTRHPGIKRTSVSSNPKVEGWRCPACGTQLHRQRTDCSICQSPKPASGCGAYARPREGGRHIRADVRSRVFTNMIRSMPAGDWRGVLRELEEEERLEEADARQQQLREEGEIDEAALSLGAPSVHCYHAVIQHLEQCGRWREASMVLRRMHTKLGGYAADVPALSAACLHKAMNACAAWGQWEACLDLMREARGWGTEASYRTFRLAIEACARSGRWEEGLSILMERSAAKTDRKWETQPFDRVMRVLSDAGRWQETAALLSRMREVGAEPGFSTFGNAIRACEHAGEWRKALDLLEDAATLLPPLPPPKAREARKMPSEAACACFASAMRACRRAGEHERALDVLLRRMPAAGVAPDARVLNEAINACAAAGRGEQATTILRETMPAAGVIPNVISYTSAMNAFSQGGEWKQAVALLGEMRDAGVEPTAVSYATAITVCGNGGQWRKAVELLAEMREPTAAAGNHEGGTSEPRSVRTYTAAIKACGNSAQWEAALALLRRGQREGLKPDAVCYAETMSACAGSGRWRETLGLLREMSTREFGGLRPTVPCYNAAIVACGAGGEWQRSLELLEEMPEAGLAPGVPTYNKAINALRQGKRWQEALALLERMLATPGLEPDATSYNSAITACENAGRFDKAVGLFREMKESANSKEGGVAPDVIGYTATVQALGRWGKWEQALELLGEMPSAGVEPSVRTYIAAIYATGRAGQWEHAVSIFRRMLSGGLVPTDQAWIAVISACKVGAAIAEESSLDGGGGEEDAKRVRAVMALLIRARDEGEGERRAEEGRGSGELRPDAEKEQGRGWKDSKSRSHS